MFRLVRSEMRFWKRCTALGLLACLMVSAFVVQYLVTTAVLFSRQAPCRCSASSSSSSASSGSGMPQQSGVVQQQRPGIWCITSPGGTLCSPTQAEKELEPEPPAGISLVRGPRALLSDVLQIQSSERKESRESRGSLRRDRRTLTEHFEVVEEKEALFEPLGRNLLSGGDATLEKRLKDSGWASLSIPDLLDGVLQKVLDPSLQLAMQLALGMRWAAPSEYFSNHSEYFSGLDEVRDDQGQEFEEFRVPPILMGDTIGCDAGSAAPYMLVMVPTVANHTATRETIRHTWASPAYPHFQGWPLKGRVTKEIKVVFLVGLNRRHFVTEFCNVSSPNVTEDCFLENGTLADPTESQAEQLWLEQSKYGDIVQYDFMDTYQNLTVKMVTALHWAATYCPLAQFVLKVDEDTFVNMPVMEQLLGVMYARSSRFVMGNLISTSNVIRVGKWQVNETLFPLPTYPPYMVGHSYVITGNAIGAMLEKAKQLPLIPIEDAYVTGLVAGLLDVPHLHAGAMANTDRWLTWDCQVLIGSYASQTHFNNRTMAKVWDAATSGQCGNFSFDTSVLVQ